LQQKVVIQSAASSCNNDISSELTAPPPKKAKLSSRSHDVRKRKFEKRLAAIRDGKKSRKLGCVHVEDDIADDIFMKMMQQDGGVTEQSNDKMVDLVDVMLQREKGEGLIALIITPTRELALQVKDHIVAVSKHTDIKVCNFSMVSHVTLSSCDALDFSYRCVQWWGAWLTRNKKDY